MEKMYMVRAGEKNFLFDEFQNKKIIAIGWNLIGDISNINDLDKIKDLVKEKYPEYKNQTINVNAGQIYRFLKEFKIDDYIITYNSDERKYLVGKIKSNYEYNKNFEFNHTRKIDWIGNVDRDVLSTTTKNSIGAISTIFEVSGNAKNEILSNLNKEIKIDEINEIEEHETLDLLKEDFQEKAHEFIKDKVLLLSWDEMQELVASLIRALGFKTRVSQKGSDRGKDIIASPDGLGLEEPRIIIEVKHRQGQMGSQEIRSFLGGFRQGNKGIFVSTGGFSKDAKYEAERANYPITLIDSDFLIELIIANYDNFDVDGKALIPLRKIYWPA